MSVICVSLISCSSNDEPTPPPVDPSVIFQDEFASFNSSVWTKETHPAGWTNSELQSYSPDNVSVGKDGSRTVLILTATRKGNTFVSGRVNSKGKINFTEGVLEASIKLPKTANGLWPAFWMMGNNSKAWPACGEIDIMEMGDAQGIKDGTQARRVNTAIHYGPNSAGHEQQYFAGSATADLQDGNYHTYKLVRTAADLKIYIDGQLFTTYNVSGNEYMQGSFHVLFNLAVGGQFTGIYSASGITALKDGEKAMMYVDWVKISKL